MGEGVLVKTLFSGISRGTERLVFEGRVPQSESSRMRALFQEGDFSFPVKFGYCSVGQIQEGELAGRQVFTLYPHQNIYRIPTAMLNFLPEGLDPERAVLAANMETALNIVWDSGVSAGDRVSVIGTGVVGALVGYLIARIPGTEITLVDINPSRASLAQTLGCKFALPKDAPVDNDVVIHTSSASSGIELALEIAGQEATIVEASWFGDRPVSLVLGGAFHSRRLRLISSQVGNLPAAKTPRWNHQRRMAMALDLLKDPKLDELVSGESAFEDLAENYSKILTSTDTLCHRIRY
jgi:threonine dehydrogenase-like Zn-dependent dehydrogenase